MIVKTINSFGFVDSFFGNYRDNFSYEGKIALFEYLEELSEDGTNIPIELDIVALCCEYTEYKSADECASNYFEYEGMTFDEDGAELETVEQVEEKALNFLRDRTQVIEFDGGIIIQDF